MLRKPASAQKKPAAAKAALKKPAKAELEKEEEGEEEEGEEEGEEEEAEDDPVIDDKLEGKNDTLQLGCKSCRGSSGGCRTCRNPEFQGWRGTKAEYEAQRDLKQRMRDAQDVN